MLELQTLRSYEIVRINLSRKPEYQIHIRGKRKTLITKGRGIAFFCVSKSKDVLNDRKNARQIMAETRASMTRYISKNLGNIPVIQNIGTVMYDNPTLWNKLPAGTEFYLIDANHCYWRVAYILGYLSKRLYLKYCDNPDFKTLRNIALAVLTSKILREYYLHGEKSHEVVCDISDYLQLYTNIRYYTYNNSGEVRDATRKYCIAYRVDGVYLLAPGLRRAKSIFRENSLLYKTRKCIKIDDKNYSTEDGEIKKMI